MAVPSFQPIKAQMESNCFLQQQNYPAIEIPSSESNHQVLMFESNENEEDPTNSLTKKSKPISRCNSQLTFILHKEFLLSSYERSFAPFSKLPVKIYLSYRSLRI